MALTIEDFGGRVATIWSQLRPTTRKMVERALQQSAQSQAQGRGAPYDARADLELSKLLEALDEDVSETRVLSNKQETDKLRSLADTCAAVLLEKTQSAEVFVQLIERARIQHDYKRVDALADALAARFAPSEICELARSPNKVVRALAQEALTQSPTNVLIGMLHDPVDSEVAREALHRQARDYGSEHARQIVSALEQIDLDTEEM